MELEFEERFEKIERDIEKIKAILKDLSRVIDDLYNLNDHLRVELGLVTVNKKGYDLLLKYMI